MMKLLQRLLCWIFDHEYRGLVDIVGCSVSPVEKLYRLSRLRCTRCGERYKSAEVERRCETALELEREQNARARQRRKHPGSGW